LHAGGFHAQKWAVDCNWVWTPSDVLKLAEGIGGTRMTWKDFLKVLKTSGIGSGDFVNRHGTHVTQARDATYCSTGADTRLSRRFHIPKCRVHASPVASAPGALGALTQPRSRTGRALSRQAQPARHPVHDLVPDAAIKMVCPGNHLHVQVRGAAGQVVKRL